MRRPWPIGAVASKKKTKKNKAPGHDWPKLRAPLLMLPPTSITQALSSLYTFTFARKLTGAFNPYPANVENIVNS